MTPDIVVDAAVAAQTPGPSDAEPWLIAGPIEQLPYDTRTLKMTFGTAEMQTLHANATISLTFTKHSDNADGTMNIVGKIAFGLTTSGVGISDKAGFTSKQPTVPADGFLSSLTLSAGVTAQFVRLQTDLLLGNLPKLFDNTPQNVDIAKFTAAYSVPALGGGTVDLKLSFDEATRGIRLSPSFSGTSIPLSGVGADININGTFAFRATPMIATALLTPFTRLATLPHHPLPGGDHPQLPGGDHPQLPPAH